MRRALVLLAGPALAAALAAPAGAASLDTTTTSYATIGGDAAAPYSRLKLLPGWKRVVRDDLGAQPRNGRLARRHSLLYFAQLSDFQLADEESPVRAEVLDVANGAFISAWRPQEALEPFTVDEVVRQVNRFDQSPVRNRTRRKARLALTITTGDSADNQQINEVKWVVRLLDGGSLNPNAGVDSLACTALGAPAGEGVRYTGVQDDDDVLESGRFYDPDRPSGAFAAWPRHPGLMDRAQQPFDAAGLDKPSYVTFGNHDGGAGQHPRAEGARRHRARLPEAARADRPRRTRRAHHDTRADDRRSGGPRARLRRPSALQGAARDREAVRRARLRLRRRCGALGVEGPGGLLRVQPEAGAAPDRDQHRCRGRPAELERQPRRPAVSLVAAHDRGGRGQARARHAVRPPPDPQPHEHRVRRAGRLV